MSVSWCDNGASVDMPMRQIGVQPEHCRVDRLVCERGVLLPGCQI